MLLSKICHVCFIASNSKTLFQFRLNLREHFGLGALKVSLYGVAGGVFVPSVLRYLAQTGSLHCQEREKGFTEGSSKYLKWALNWHLGVPLLSTEFAEPKVEPCRDITLHFLCIFFKVFRAMCKVLIEPHKIPAAFVMLDGHACVGARAGLRYGQYCLDVAEREGPGHRAAQRFCSQNHVLGKKMMCKWDRLHPSPPALLLFLKTFH